MEYIECNECGIETEAEGLTDGLCEGCWEDTLDSGAFAGYEEVRIVLD
jgi:hypothetical protein